MGSPYGKSSSSMTSGEMSSAASCGLMTCGRGASRSTCEEAQRPYSEIVLTKYRHINSQRHQIPDVPVLYLVEPTEANLKIIAADLAKSLYADAYVNFLHSISRPAMEEFAAQIATAGTSESIAQVYDQYLNFIVAEPDLFSLAMGQETFWALNSATTEDEKLDSLIDRVVTGLFSVAVTMGKLCACLRVGIQDVA